ncbi:hypothetical protein BDAP_001335 [Binucleata daphniae]
MGDQQNKNHGVQECATKNSQCYLECKKNHQENDASNNDNNNNGLGSARNLESKEILKNCYLDCNSKDDKPKENIGKPNYKTMQTIYETRTITENEPVSTMANNGGCNQNGAQVQLPCVDAASDIIKAVTSQIMSDNQPKKSESKETETITKTEHSQNENKKSISISASEITKTTTTTEECKEDTKTKREERNNDDDDYKSKGYNKSSSNDAGVVTVTRFLYETTTIEKPLTLFREITTTITLDHPIINYKITTVTENDTITTTKSKIETLTSFVTKTSIKQEYTTVSVTLEPSISYKTEKSVSTRSDTETIYETSTSVSTAFSTLISSLISTLLSQETSTIDNKPISSQNEVTTIDKAPEKVTEYLLQPTTKSVSTENVFEKEFLPMLKKLMENQSSQTKSNDQETVTVTDSKKTESKEDICDEKKEKATVTKIETETITKYKKSKPKTITKSSVKKKTVTVTENADKNKGPKTVYNTFYKYDKKNEECIEPQNNEKPSKTVTIFSNNNEECGKE